MRNVTSSLPEDSGYIRGLRLAVALGAIFAWGLSIWWSSDGFNISVQNYQWLGVCLGLFVTVSELLFNQGSSNPTIWIVGLFAYTYGYGTNVAGINQFLDLPTSGEIWKLDTLSAIINVCIVYGLAAIVEIAPEAFLLWAIYPDRTSFGDFVSSLLGGANIKNNRQKRPNRSNSNRINQFYGSNMEQNSSIEQNKRFNGTKQTKPFPFTINWRNIDQDTNISKVLSFYKEYWNKTGRECPNKELVRNTRVSKGQVSQIVSKLKSGGFS